MNTTSSATPSHFREATADEVVHAARQQEALADWEAVLAFARAIYGETIHEIELELDHTFDDGVEHRHLIMIHASTQAGEPLVIDFLLPYWQKQGYGGQTRQEEVESTCAREIKELQELYQRQVLSEKQLAQARAQAIRYVVGEDLPELAHLDFSSRTMYADRPPLPAGEQLLTLYIQE